MAYIVEHEDHEKLLKWWGKNHGISKSLNIAVQLLLLVHTPVTRKVFEYFNCHNVSGVSFLRADYTINCWTSSKWLTFLSYIIIVGGSFSIGFPLLVSIYLLRNWKNLHSAKLLARTGFLYIDFTRGDKMAETKFGFDRFGVHKFVWLL